MPRWTATLSSLPAVPDSINVSRPPATRHAMTFTQHIPRSHRERRHCDLANDRKRDRYALKRHAHPQSDTRAGTHQCLLAFGAGTTLPLFCNRSLWPLRRYGVPGFTKSWILTLLRPCRPALQLVRNRPQPEHVCSFCTRTVSDPRPTFAGDPQLARRSQRTRSRLRNGSNRYGGRSSGLRPQRHRGIQASD